MTPMEATARASANIAFVKYWGNVDERLRLPYNDSVSMNLSDATTTTRVAFERGSGRDEVVVDGRPLTGPAHERAAAQLDRIRALAGLAARAVVASANTFPMGTGIASSASGYAALTVAAAAAAGLELDEPTLSALARRGSGSAARSIPGGFTWWRADATDAGSYAFTLAPPDHWELRDLVAVVSRAHKRIGSGGGHAAAVTSACFPARLAALPDRLAGIREALLARDLASMGPLVEEEALSLHAVALTSRPPILYWSPGTVAVIEAVRQWRDEGLAAYFTLDAGPNVHVICEGPNAPELERRLSALDAVERVLVNAPAGPAAIVDPAP